MQFVQAAFVVEEWVDHALDKAQKVEDKLDATKKAHTKADKKLKETLVQLAEVEKSRKNAKAALNSFEKQAAES